MSLLIDVGDELEERLPLSDFDAAEGVNEAVDANSNGLV